MVVAPKCGGRWGAVAPRLESGLCGRSAVRSTAREDVYEFARQMRALARTGWRTLTLDEFADRGDPAEHRVFLLTFDDGYASLADYAYPLLADLGYTATTFLVTDYVGRMNTWDLRYTWRRLPHLD